MMLEKTFFPGDEIFKHLNLLAKPFALETWQLVTRTEAYLTPLPSPFPRKTVFQVPDMWLKFVQFVQKVLPFLVAVKKNSQGKL